MKKEGELVEGERKVYSLSVWIMKFNEKMTIIMVMSVFNKNI